METNPNPNPSQQQALTAYTYPKRPRRDEQREKGDKKTKVICNLREIILGDDVKKVQQYAIHFDPPVAENNLPLKRQIIRQLKGDLSGNFGKYFQAGDTLFIYCKDPTESLTLETKVDETNYKVKIVRTSNYINCRKLIKKETDTIKVKSFLESMINHIFYANNHIIRFDKSSFYDYEDMERFGRGNAKIWHGYSSAVCLTECGLTLRINDKNKMITGKTALDKMKEIAHRYRGNIRGSDCVREIKEFFSGKTVVATYGNYRAYRIGDVSFDNTIDNTEFDLVNKEGNDKKKISIRNYYKVQYGFEIKDSDQPLLIEEEDKRDKKLLNDNNSKNGNDEGKVTRYLVPELVFLTGIDELDERDRADIIAKSKFQPSEKVARIEKGLKYLTQKEKKHVKRGNNKVDKPSPDEIRQEWGINFGNHFIEVEARCLSTPSLEFGKGKENVQLNHGRFRQREDYRPINFSNSNCMLITFDRLKNLAKTDCDQMNRAGEQYGVHFSLPELQQMNYTTQRDELVNELKRIDFNNGKKIAIVVLDRNTKNLYSSIKDFLYSQGGITSQFMLHDENPRGGGRKKQNMSYYGAVLNQMVVKAQGELFRIGFCSGISNSPSMLIGIDSSRLKDGTKYVLSASYNRSFNKFYTDIKIGKIEDKPLSELIKGAINYFKSVNNNYKPQNIIIYRQGGNEKQTEKLIRTELPQILDLLEKGGYEEGYKPKLTIFSVNKKTELKFFENSGKGYRNIPSGTVIDQKVISPDVFEFYLQCPDVDRGTGSPVHFLCIYNTNETLTLNEFEEISLKQSYYYWNWPGPVRIPAALKYAEVANMFSTRHLKNDVLTQLKNSPYFI